MKWLLTNRYDVISMPSCQVPDLGRSPSHATTEVARELNMASNLIFITAIVAALSVITGVGAGVLRYTPKDPHDPENVSMVREALATAGIDPEGISIKSIFKKDWGIGDSYKATYVDRRGRVCHVHFQDRSFTGITLKGTPSCDNREIGVGAVDGGGFGGDGKVAFKTKIKVKLGKDGEDEDKDKSKES